MTEIIINSFDEYRDLISKQTYRVWVYRGQNNYSYELQSSLYRAFKNNESIRSASKEKKIHIKREKYESEMIKSFKKGCKIFLDKAPSASDDLDWLSLMQHYGAPTRLLDFSYSPYIALYFAVSGASEDAAVFCIKTSVLKDIGNSCTNKSIDRIMKENTDSENTYVFPYEPKFQNERIFVQQGLFIVPNTLDFTHQEILDTFNDIDDEFIKIRIKKECIVEIIEELSKMNINASSVYPGFEGFCKSFENIGILPLQMIKSMPNLFEEE